MTLNHYNRAHTLEILNTRCNDATGTWQTSALGGETLTSFIVGGVEELEDKDEEEEEEVEEDMLLLSGDHQLKLGGENWERNRRR